LFGNQKGEGVMRKIVAFMFFVLVSVSTVFAQNNTVVFDNQSGEPALVKLIGPTDREVEVAAGAKGTVTATAGRYHIKVRYGAPGKYHYAKGEEFEVKETATSKSKTTITLHKVVAGNYDSRPISDAEFNGNGKSVSPSPSNPKQDQTEAEKQKAKGETKTTDADKSMWDWVMTTGKVDKVYKTVEHSGPGPVYLYMVQLRTSIKVADFKSRFGQPVKVEESNMLMRSAGRIPPESCEYWYYGNLRVAVRCEYIEEIHGNFPPPKTE
jgi:hypothetical protein